MIKIFFIYLKPASLFNTFVCTYTGYFVVVHLVIAFRLNAILLLRVLLFACFGILENEFEILLC